MIIDSSGKTHRELNEMIREANANVTVKNCLGQRFIACGHRDAEVTLYGTPGNALGAYLDGAAIIVHGNAQDATGDTMNQGRIVIHGSAGDAAGYSMRGGEIYVRDNAGYRAGIHMKAYADKLPVIIIGGSCGSFLGEYQAGGIIIVLGQNPAAPIVGNFCGTGMHGGKIYLRCDKLNIRLPSQVKACEASQDDMKEINEYIRNYCAYFGTEPDGLLNSKYFVLTPNSINPYKQLYIRN
jgi:glutamate synthase domain-containing protein 3